MYNNYYYKHLGSKLQIYNIEPVNPNIETIDVKCDNPDNEQMCKDYNVPGFPYVIIEKDNVKTPYEGPRTAEAMLNNII